MSGQGRVPGAGGVPGTPGASAAGGAASANKDRRVPGGAPSAGDRCPVLLECLEQGEELKWLLKRLHRSRRVCRACIDAGQCELNALLRQVVGRAALEVLSDLRQAHTSAAADVTAAAAPPAVQQASPAPSWRKRRQAED